MTWPQSYLGDDAASLSDQGQENLTQYSIFHHASEIHLGEEASLGNRKGGITAEK
jgi:hypothetical protein